MSALLIIILVLALSTLFTARVSSSRLPRWMYGLPVAIVAFALIVATVLIADADTSWSIANLDDVLETTVVALFAGAIAAGLGAALIPRRPRLDWDPDSKWRHGICWEPVVVGVVGAVLVAFWAPSSAVAWMHGVILIGAGIGFSRATLIGHDVRAESEGVAAFAAAGTVLAAMWPLTMLDHARVDAMHTPVTKLAERFADLPSTAAVVDGALPITAMTAGALLMMWALSVRGHTTHRTRAEVALLVAAVMSAPLVEAARWNIFERLRDDVFHHGVHPDPAVVVDVPHFRGSHYVHDQPVYVIRSDRQYVAPYRFANPFEANSEAVDLEVTDDGRTMARQLRAAADKIAPGDRHSIGPGYVVAIDRSTPAKHTVPLKNALQFEWFTEVEVLAKTTRNGLQVHTMPDPHAVIVNVRPTGLEVTIDDESHRFDVDDPQKVKALWLAARVEAERGDRERAGLLLDESWEQFAFDQMRRQIVVDFDRGFDPPPVAVVLHPSTPFDGFARTYDALPRFGDDRYYLRRPAVSYTVSAD